MLFLMLDETKNSIKSGTAFKFKLTDGNRGSNYFQKKEYV
jgi:hypothetical protein